MLFCRDGEELEKIIESLENEEEPPTTYKGKAKKNNMRGSGYPNYPKFLPPILNFFLQILNRSAMAQWWRECLTRDREAAG